MAKDDRAALAVIFGGVCAALHVGKLPPAVPELQQALGLSLMQAGFLVSLVQLAGMTVAVAVGAWVDAIGLRRSMLLGLFTLSVVGALGATVSSPVPLMVLRGLEGFAFLVAVLPAPALLRRLVSPQRLFQVMGWWTCYIPFGTALALLVGPFVMRAWGWPVWWVVVAGCTLVAVLAVARWVPASQVAPDVSSASSIGAARVDGFRSRLARTLRAPAPWFVAITFACYSAQWLAVIGFLPTIYVDAGLSLSTMAMATALASAVNMSGNVMAGRWLARGVPARRLLLIGLLTMAVAGVAAFAGRDGAGLPPLLRFAAVLVMSSVGGMVPSVLFSLAARAAPDDATVSTTVGWLQQWSALGQFLGPPAAAWMAQRVGGWHATWVVTGACALMGCAWALAATSPRLRR